MDIHSHQVSLRRGVPLEKISCLEIVDWWDTVSPNIHTGCTAAWCNVCVWKTNFGALDSPQAWLSQSLLYHFSPCSYILHSTLHLPHNTSIDPHTQLVNWKKRTRKRNLLDMEKKIEITKQKKIVIIVLIIITLAFLSPLPVQWLKYKYITSIQHSCVRECCSIQLGASGLPYYCAPLVCVPAVLER